MINTEILREYDIRGIFQKSLTLEDVKNISYKLATIIRETNDHKIIIGHDGRASSLEIKNTLIENFNVNKKYPSSIEIKITKSLSMI